MITIQDNRVILLDQKYTCFVDKNGEIFNVAYFEGELVDSYLEDIYFVIMINKSGYLTLEIERKYQEYFTQSKIAKFLSGGMNFLKNCIKNNTFFNPVAEGKRVKVVKRSKVVAKKVFGKKVETVK